AMACLKLDYELYEDINRDYFSIEMQVIPILIEMSYKGLLVDQERRQSVEDSLAEQAEYYRNLCEEMGFNPGSPQQVAYILAARGAYNVFTRLPFTRNKYGRKTGNLSTSVETLRKMEDPIVPVILEYRTYTKLLSTYIRPWAHEDRAYCLAPKTKVLKSDLTWVPINSLMVGDELIGVSKHKNGKWCQVGSTVEGTNTIIDESYRIITDKGTVISNGEHPWLCVGTANYWYGRGGKWVLTKDLKPTDKIKYFGGVWHEDVTYDGGYLAGILDGEGWVSRAEVGISQKDETVYQRITDLIECGLNLMITASIQGCKKSAINN
ncbi:hypothetical protein LCGC14_3120420, partial [marine sediment metagenome]